MLGKPRRSAAGMWEAALPAAAALTSVAALVAPTSLAALAAPISADRPSAAPSLVQILQQHAAASITTEASADTLTTTGVSSADLATGLAGITAPIRMTAATATRITGTTLRLLPVWLLLALTSAASAHHMRSGPRALRGRTGLVRWREAEAKRPPRGRDLSRS